MSLGLIPTLLLLGVAVAVVLAVVVPVSVMMLRSTRRPDGMGDATDEHEALADRLKAIGDRASASRVLHLAKQHHRLSDAIRGETMDRSLIDPEVYADVGRLHDAAYRAYQRSVKLDAARREVDTRAVRERLAGRRVDLLVEAKAASDALTHALDHAHAVAVERDRATAGELSAARNQLDRSLTLAREIEDLLGRFDREVSEVARDLPAAL